MPAAELKLIGANPGLAQHATVLKFEIAGKAPGFRLGRNVSVFVEMGAPITGIILPRSAVVQAPNGQYVVFRHAEPERFEPVAVKFVEIDASPRIADGRRRARRENRRRGRVADQSDPLRHDSNVQLPRHEQPPPPADRAVHCSTRSSATASTRCRACPSMSSRPHQADRDGSDRGRGHGTRRRWSCSSRGTSRPR